MTVEYLKEAAKELERLDPRVRKLVADYMNEIKSLENPRSRGKALTGNLSGLWRYRVENYRIICRIQDQRILDLFGNWWFPHKSATFLRLKPYEKSVQVLEAVLKLKFPNSSH